MSLQAINFDLKITPGSIPPVLHMSQYDSGRQYTAYLKDEENTAFIPGAGATAKLKGFNAAGVPWEQAATVDGSTVVFTPSGAATDQFGIMPVTIEITVGSEKLTPLLMIFDIQRAGYTNEQAVRSPEFETAMEAAVAEALTEVGILLADNQATKTAAMTQPVGADADGKLWTTPGGGGLSDDAKQRLLACFAHVAWTDEHGQDYYDALEDALYPPADLVSITAVYLQDRPIYDTDDLDAIKASDDLTVTAHYSNGTSVVLDDEDYTLSGTLTVGTSIITVSYGGKTDTISVTVTAHGLLPEGYQQYDWVRYTGTNKSNALAAEQIRTKKFDNLNELVIDFDFMPYQSQTGATAVVIGGQKTGQTGSAYTIAFYSRTDTKRVSVFSHGTALGINDAPNVEVGKVVHVNLNPGSASPSVLTVDTLTDSQAWTNTNTIDSEFAVCGNAYGSNANTLTNYPAVGIMRFYNLSGVLVGEYVPCVRTADNVIGIYDTVTEAFYTAGTVEYATIGNASCEYAVGSWEEAA